MASIFHIVPAADWDEACNRGSYTPASLTAEGFVHFSYRSQVARTANARFAGRDGLVVVEFDPARLADPVVDEDLYGAGECFPHIYAAIPTALATAVHPLPRDADGRFGFPIG
jgi:uncharacterized protein (DUF952 family)